MKKLLILAILSAFTTVSFSQSLGYQDLGLLFSQDDNIGTARFTAMSGAFGALGGDISSININPAGLSVFNNSSFTGTFNSRNSQITSDYYGNSLMNDNQFINLSQAGAVLVFREFSNSGWDKFAVGFNYRLTKDFSDDFNARGNSGVATFTEFPLDNNNPPINYNIADEQAFNNTYGGDLSEFNIGFSAVHQNKLHVGLALNFYDLNFSQRSTLSEFNSDSNGNELDAFLYQENFTSGQGFSANLGFIYKANQYFRFGLSYQTPTWFSEVLEESNILDNDGYLGDTEIFVSNDSAIYDNTAGGFFPSQALVYRLRTPSKLTASGALIFGKNGLLSFDYTNKNFKNITLSGADFSQENQSFQDDYQNTHNFNVGAEWRLDRLSLRGGYRFEQSPDINALESDDLKGYSLGAGYNFGNFKVDLSYSDSNRTAAYNFYSGFNVDAANLTLDNKVFTASVSLSL
ncbi:OmpP1/FadL family transporter [Polaribacter sp. MED152]|uniref:OmpP1/FadL family transporter n=1 Tax=Polaribacter sp. MED152 TaxID=313598 RepID=UPI0000689AA2|nr:outer membrane protein transport protein [Polaribacter sp. MED152]EAQ40586.1 outer membrane protein transport protein (OMPP1/FadL/TodX) [Polaribacter sp. MED152]